MHTVFAKAVAFKEAKSEGFRGVQARTVDNAKTLAAVLIESGLRLVSGGTDNHLMLIDLRPLGLTGKVAANLLEEAGIVVNKNTVPYDPRSPSVCSGIRLGTPALSTRGMGAEEMKEIAQWIVKVLKQADDDALRIEIADRVRALCANFPLEEIA
jgi:glycine hydroxymethyltransferase